MAQAPPLTMSSPPDAIAAAALGTQRGMAFIGTLNGDRMAYGMARNDVPASSIEPAQQPMFEIGSVTKVFTGLLLAQAVERGELSLDDRIGLLLAGKVTLPPAVAAITLRQLVTHSACLSLMADGAGPGPALVMQLRDVDRAMLWAALARTRLSAAHAPCEAVYSNFGMAVLGEVLADRLGKPWETLVQERVTGPLGMRDTVLQLGDKAGRLVPAFSGARAESAWDMKAYAGAGGLRSTAHDMLIFARAVLAGAQGPLGPAAERLVQPLGRFKGGEIGYAIQVLGPPERRTWFHDGLTGGYSTLWMLAPDTSQAIVMLVSNARAPRGIRSTVANGRYPVDGTAVQVDTSELPAYAGVYRVDKDMAMSFAARDGVLYGRITQQGFNALTPSAPGRFVFPSVNAEFSFARSGREPPSAVTLRQGGRIFEGRRVDEPVAALMDGAQLKAYEGRYRMPSGAEFEVRAKGHQLEARLAAQPSFAVFAVAGQPDRFYYEAVKAELQFERAADGRVDALVLHQNGVHRSPRVGD